MRLTFSHASRHPLFTERNTGLLYSLYLVLGSASLFVFFLNMYTTVQAFIWQYSEKYIVGASLLAFAALVSSILLLLACVQMWKQKKMAKVLGFSGCILLLIYPMCIFLIDTLLPYSSTYLLALSVPAAFVLIFSLVLWKRFSLAPEKTL